MSRLFFTIALVGVALSALGGGTVLLLSRADMETKGVFHKADVRMAARRFTEAEDLLLERFPNEGERTADVWLRLGVCRSMREDWQGAEAMFRAGLRLAPDDARLEYNQALLYDRMGDADRAEAALNRMRESGAYFPGVSYHLGRLAEDRGDLKTADAYYVEELNKDPSYHLAWERHLILSRRWKQGASGEKDGQQ